MSSDRYTPNTDLAEKIADALVTRGIRFAYQTGPLEARALAAAVLPIVEAEVRKAKVEALREIAPHLNDSGDESFLIDAATEIENGAGDEQ